MLQATTSGFEIPSKFATCYEVSRAIHIAHDPPTFSSKCRFDLQHNGRSRTDAA